MLFHKWLHGSYDTFDHTTIHQFNAVIYLWNCAMTLCTERGDVMAVLTWRGSIGNSVDDPYTETGLKKSVWI